MPEEKFIDYDQLEKALDEEIREIMREDSQNIKIDIMGRIVGRINELLPEGKKLTENDIKSIRAKIRKDEYFLGDYKTERNELYNYTIFGVNKNFGQKLITSARIVGRFFKKPFDIVRDVAAVTISTVGLVVGGVISAIGYVVGAIPIVGTILRHVPGSSKNYHYEGFLFESKRINVIRNIGDNIMYYAYKISQNIESKKKSYLNPPSFTVSAIVSSVRPIELERKKIQPSPAKRELDNDIKSQVDNLKKDVGIRIPPAAQKLNQNIKPQTDKTGEMKSDPTPQFSGPHLIKVMNNRNNPVSLQKHQPVE